MGNKSRVENLLDQARALPSNELNYMLDSLVAEIQKRKEEQRDKDWKAFVDALANFVDNHGPIEIQRNLLGYTCIKIEDTNWVANRVGEIKVD